MNARLTSIFVLAMGATAGLFAFDGGGEGGRDFHPGNRHHGGPPPGGHDSLGKERRQPPKLTEEQKAFVESERTLRDSMFQAIASYSDTVRKGTDPRSLYADRARINDYAQRIERLRSQNVDTWLDVIALRPMPWGERHPRGPHDSGDSLRPPPPPPCEGESARAR